MILGTMALLALLASVGICYGTGAFLSLTWLWVLPVGFLGIFLGIGLVGFLILWAIVAVVDTDKPQEHDDPFYRRLTGFAVEFVVEALQVRLHPEGMEKLPKDGRILLVCNHLSLLDPLMLLHMFPKTQLAFISKKEVNDMFIVGKLMHRIMCQLIDRENDREALKTILKCIQLLKSDEVSVGVFPEGYTSKDGYLHPFRSGVFKIAQKAQVPIVVCTIQGTQHIFHNAIRLRHTDVQLHLVDVMPAPPMRGVTAVEIGNEVHEKMIGDLGEDKRYVEPETKEDP